MPGHYFFYIGRLPPSGKGVDVLPRLPLARRPARGGVSELVIAGDGEVRAALEEQAARLGLLPRVRFVGVVRGEAKAYLLQNARCLVVPSRGWEAFGLVVLEAYASRVPVIASRLLGMQELESSRAGRAGFADAPSPGDRSWTRRMELGLVPRGGVPGAR